MIIHESVVSAQPYHLWKKIRARPSCDFLIGSVGMAETGHLPIDNNPSKTAFVRLPWAKKLAVRRLRTRRTMGGCHSNFAWHRQTKRPWSLRLVKRHLAKAPHLAQQPHRRTVALGPVDQIIAVTDWLCGAAGLLRSNALKFKQFISLSIVVYAQIDFIAINDESGFR